MPTPKSDRVEDVVELVSRLRRWTSERDSEAYAIQGSFAQFGADVEAAAAIARPVVQEAANAVFTLITALERTTEYKRQKESHGTADSDRP